MTPLERLLTIEAARSWPRQRAAYRAALLALAAELEAQDPATREALHALMTQRFAGLLACRDVAGRQARIDALNDLVVDSERTPKLLTRAAARLGPDAPNVVSLLRARVIWDAGSILESTARRHDRRKASDEGLAEVHSLDAHSPTRVQARFVVCQIVRHMGLTVDEARVLELIGQGESIAVAARATGRSRQQVYRLLERVSEWSSAGAAA